MSDSDGMWPMARRFLSFDEPSVKDAQLSRIRGSVPDGEEHASANNLLFSAAFALEDALRFTPISFAAWAHAGRRNSVSLAAIDPALSQAIFKIGNEMGLSHDAAEWCCRLSSFAVPWHMLPDSNVVQTQLVKQTLGRICQTDQRSHFREDDLRSARQALAACVSELRGTLPANILPRAILIVEGATESILIPHIAGCLGHSLPDAALMLMAAGGAKQVSKRFFQLRDVVSLPLFCLLDADAVEQSELIRDALRAADQLHVLAEGEIEDTFENQFFAKVLNQYLQTMLASSDPISAGEFSREPPGRKKTATAQTLLRRRASIDFDKVEFARLAAQHLHSAKDIPPELRGIIGTIMLTLKQ